MRSLRGTVAATPVVLALSLSSSLAFAAEPSAADRETARALMAEGDKQFAAKAYDAAYKAYAGADGIMHVPTTSVEVAKAQEALGLLIEARDTCLRLTRVKVMPDEPNAYAGARTRCETVASAIVPRIPSITVHVNGMQPGAAPRLSVDGENVSAATISLPRRVNPGKHTVVIAAEGYAGATQTITLGEGENQTVTLDLKKESGPVAATTPAPVVSAPQYQTSNVAPASEAAGIPTYAKVAFGVGAAGLVVGTITGVMALGKASDTKAVCPNNRCPAAEQSAVDSSITMANVSNVGFAVAVVGAGVGVIGVLTRPKTEPKAGAMSWSPYVSGAGGGISGRF